MLLDAIKLKGPIDLYVTLIEYPAHRFIKFARLSPHTPPADSQHHSTTPVKPKVRRVEVALARTIDLDGKHPEIVASPAIEHDLFTI